MNFFKRLFFNLWYFRDPPWDTGVSPPELMEVIATRPPGRALDLGCGTGTNVLTLARHDWQAVGVDFAWKAIAAGRHKAHQAGLQVELLVQDVTRMEQVSGLFDLILDMGCMHSLDPAGRSAYLAQIERLLAPQGIYLLYTFIKANPDESGPGIDPADLEALTRRLTFLQRRDGTERGVRASSWLTFTR